MRARTDSPSLVYSTEAGRVCRGCGIAVDRCRCGKPQASPRAAPGRTIEVKIRLETKGRGGKSVTVVAGVPDHLGEELLGQLKRALATGGAPCDGGLELRGDCRDRLRPLLAARGFKVKG